MTKTELIKLSGIDTTKLAAMPQIWMDKCYNVGIDPLALFVGWYYGDEPCSGRPLPMSELWEMAHANNIKPTLIEAKKVLEWFASHCEVCGGDGCLQQNTFDEPPEPCHKCASLYAVILNCEKGIGS